MTDRSSPSLPTIKRLFAKSGNRCAFPRCTVELVQGDTIVGEVAHIKAASPNGPRYDPNQASTDRHGFDNLILLCANHHTVIDDDSEAYTINRLLKMKASHEAQSRAIDEATATRGSALIDQAVTSNNQTGGITAHTVNQVIHVREREPSLNGQEILRRLQRIHSERVARIDMQTLVKTLDRGMLIINILPSSLALGSTERFGAVVDDHKRFPPVKSKMMQDHRTDFEGMLVGSNADGLNKPQRAYTPAVLNPADHADSAIRASCAFFEVVRVGAATPREVRPDFGWIPSL